jgi:FkbM family methyltransferase
MSHDALSTMLTSMKGTVTGVPVVGRTYRRMRSLQARQVGGTLFENPREYSDAFHRKASDGVVLRTHDGLSIAIRRNLWDAEIVREIFFDQPYTHHLRLPPNPTIIDVGGYIGDFALYAVKCLNAARVVVYEPTGENFAMLTQNIALNGYGDRITAVQKAVGESGEMTLHVRSLDDGEIHSSPHLYADGEHRTVPSVGLAEILDAHAIDSVDLLKVDCEGGEYEIFSSVSDAVLERIKNIAFEYHAIEEYGPKLERVMNRLSSAGYELRKEGKIVVAWR